MFRFYTTRLVSAVMLLFRRSINTGINFVVLYIIYRLGLTGGVIVRNFNPLFDSSFNLQPWASAGMDKGRVHFPLGKL